jgi:hypothetical protein
VRERRRFIGICGIWIGGLGLPCGGIEQFTRPCDIVGTKQLARVNPDRSRHLGCAAPGSIAAATIRSYSALDAAVPTWS